jgi:hypothetical protein
MTSPDRKRRMLPIGFCLGAVATVALYAIVGSSGAQQPPELPGPPGGFTPIEERPRADLRRAAPTAMAGFEGQPAPGATITLRSDGSIGAEHFRWIQTQGTPVALGDPTSPAPRFRMPDGEGAVAFALVAANAQGTDVASVEVRTAAGSPQPDRPVVKADAGDDQVGIVGHQITLNGSRSEPKGQVAYRWLQVAGPKVRLELAEGFVYSFVPQAPGIYEFALVVARGNEISVPDRVAVSVGNPASPYGIEPTTEAPEALHDVARAALGTVPGGLEVGPPLAECFDAVADRMDLYHSYGEAFSELSRRLEPLLPPDAVRRSVWNERLFGPLTARLIEGLRAEGLDLRNPEAQTAALTSAQRARAAELFRSMARGFRATRPGA